MSKKLLVDYFDNWLDKNITRFKYKPIKIGFNTYCFQGINNNITLQVSQHIRELIMIFQSPNKIETNTYDNDCDMLEIGTLLKVKHIKNKGYCDLLWMDEYKKDRYYKNYKQMIHKELFEPLVKYCDSYFIKDNSYYVTEACDNIISAFIANNSNTKVIKKNCINITTYKFNLFQYYT